MSKELYKHQADYLESHWDSEFYALFWEMGCGKTRAILEGINKLCGSGQVEYLIVIAPNGVHSNWPKRQAPIWLDVPYEYVIWDDTRNLKAWRENFEHCMSYDGLKIIAMNVEAFQTKDGNGIKFASNIINRGAQRSFLVIDESSTIKSPKANRSKEIVKLSRLCKYRRILTGTPITQSPFDVWMQGEALKKNIWRKNYYMFRQHHGQFKIARFGNRSFEELVMYRNLDEIRESIQEWGSEVIKSECMDLPPKVYEVIEVDMSDEQIKAYREMRDYYVATLGQTVVTTDTPLTKLTKLHQIACGHILDEDGNTIRLKHNRIKALQTALDSLACKVIIYCQFRDTLREIVEHLGDACVEYSGRINDTDRNSAVDRFQSSPDIRYIVISLQSSGAYGLDLYAAGAVIYASNGYSLERRMQSEDRAHRPGQVHDCVTYIDLICPNTVEEGILTALTTKIDVASQVTRLMTDWLR
jgi:SNF2 family DNA or RNA helicase